MSFSFHPEAEKEFNAAIDYYEDIEPGFGYDFALEVHSTIKRAVDVPKAWAVLEGDVRRSLVRRFPYGILYSEGCDGPRGSEYNRRNGCGRSGAGMHR